MTGRQQVFTKKFQREAVPLTWESGRTVREIADDLGIGMSTLTRGRRMQKGHEPVQPLDDPHKELARLRRENDILRQERDLLKKQRPSLRRRVSQPAIGSRAADAMTFLFIAAQKAKLTVERACKLMDVSPSGYYAACERPVSRRARQDMTLLAHIRAAFTQSNETYGSPRMVHELRDAGFVSDVAAWHA